MLRKYLKSILAVGEHYHPGTIQAATDHIAAYESQVGMIDPLTLMTLISAVISLIDTVVPGGNFMSQLLALLQKLLPIPTPAPTPAA